MNDIKPYHPINATWRLFRIHSVLFSILLLATLLITGKSPDLILASLLFGHFLFLLIDFSILFFFGYNVAGEISLENKENDTLNNIADPIINTLLGIRLAANFWKNGQDWRSLKLISEKFIKSNKIKKQLLKSAKEDTPEILYRVKSIYKREDIDLNKKNKKVNNLIIKNIKKQQEELKKKEKLYASITKKAKKYHCNNEVVKHLKNNDPDKAKQVITKAVSLLKDSKRLNIKDKIKNLLQKGEFKKAKSVIEKKSKKERWLREIKKPWMKKIKKLPEKSQEKLIDLLEEAESQKMNSRKYRKTMYELKSKFEKFATTNQKNEESKNSSKEALW